MKADVLNLVSLLSNNTADISVIAVLYDEIIEQWVTLKILTNAYLVTQNAGDNTVDMPANLLDVDLFIWNSTQLGQLTQREVESIDPGWRNRVGNPTSFILDDTKRTLTIYPGPALPSAPDLGTFGEPLGLDYPPYSLVMIGSERRTDVPVQFELPLALLLIQREFSRESDHTDIDFATLAGQMGQSLLTMARGLLPSVEQ